MSTPGYKGLYLIDTKRGKIRQINTDAGAGYEPVFSSDGRYICFKSDDFSGQRKLSSLLKYDLITNETSIIEEKTRNITQPVPDGNSIVYSTTDGIKVKGFKDNLQKSSVVNTIVLLEDLTPVLYINGIRKPLKPGGDGSYIWVSLSPDKKMLLYYLAGKGTFVCDLDGKILCSAGKLNAPRWFNNQLIVGMDDKDDGYRVTSSEVVSYSVVTGKRTNLTTTDRRNEMYPFPFTDGKRIAFQTPEGELYIMKVKVK